MSTPTTKTPSTNTPATTPPPPPKNILALILGELKFVHVIVFTVGLFRDLLNLERLNRDKKDYVKRLLYLVLKKNPNDKNSSSPFQAQFHIWLLFFLSIIRTILILRSATLLKKLSAAVYQRDGSLFKDMFKQIVMFIAGASALTATHNYSKSMLTVLFRERMTDVIHKKYFHFMNYYHLMNLDGSEMKPIMDANTRISKELASVSQRLANLITLFVSSLPPIITFTYQLWSWRGMKFALIPHAYLMVAYEVAQRLFPKNIGDLYRDQAGAQGQLYGVATRLQTHSESIAALDGSKIESVILNSRFKKVEQATSKLHYTVSKFGLIFKLAYTYGCRSWITSFIMLPILLKSNETNISLQVSEVRHSMYLMIEMLIANGNILTLHAMSQHMIGVCARICGLIDTLDKLELRQSQAKSISMEEGEEISFENVQVHTPNGHHLVKDLTFKVSPGSCLLLTGHNGAGKSSIFRCLGGLWNVREGRIVKPGASTTGLHQDIFYLPQKPYNVLGTLKDQLTYPLESASLSRDELKKLLDMVNLGYLLNQLKGKEDEEVNWDEKLSLGEQQRLAMARLFYHKPKFAILDECTSAVSTDMETLLYSECNQMGITYITICHRPALKAYHDINLHLTGDDKGGWQVVPLNKDLSHSKRFPDSQKLHIGDIEKLVEKRSEPYASLKDKKPIPKRSAISKLKLLLGIIISRSSANEIISLISAILFRTLCHESYSYIVGQLFQGMIKKDISHFMKFTIFSVFQDIVSSFSEESVIFLQARLGTTWFNKLSQHVLAKFFKNNAFYRLQHLDKRVQDADQRLTKEINNLTEEASAIWGHAITPLIDIIWFSWRLHSYIGPKVLFVLFGYVATCYSVIKVFMPNYDELEGKEQKLESRFQFIHDRVCTNGESIAFFGGDKKEKEIADKQFSKLVKHMSYQRMRDSLYKFVFLCVSKNYDDYSNIISVPEVLKLFVQLLYVMNQDGGKMNQISSSASIVSDTFYVQNAADRAIHAFGKLSNLYEHVIKLLGSSTRVCELIDVLEDLNTNYEQKLQNQKMHYTDDNDTEHPCLKMIDVDIVTPNGNCLASNLTVQVPLGQSLMVTGPNSIGKTSFFRVLAKLWPTPKGIVSCPSEKVFLVPQRPYSVLGTLADQITYPAHVDKEKRDKDLEDKMLDALEKAGIKRLAEREGWDTIRLWENTLSLGEQQRMGIARLFFHRPHFAVLDECTDAVSMDVEHKLYKSLHECGITFVTISKRLALTEFHTNELRFGVPTERGWELFKVDEKSEA